MTGKLPSSASVAAKTSGDKLCAPAAERNTAVLCDLLRAHAPPKGQALEIASGTGQHVIAFARALPDITWQPTEIDAERLASIDAYRQDAKLSNIVPPEKLDASVAGWHEILGPQDLIVLINLLHLITEADAKTLMVEAMSALADNGRFVLYGPFKRDGALTSAGDARFHQQLTDADPMIGYKNDTDILQWLRHAGAATIECADMPANNLAFIATR